MALTRMIWDFPADTCLMDKGSSGNTTAVYSYEPDRFGSLLSQHVSVGSGYFHFDAQDSTRQMTEEDASVTVVYVYSAFGEEMDSQGVQASRFRFAGRWGYSFNPELNTHYVRARHYSSAAGRWLSVDPLCRRDANALSPHLNYYEYVNNAPTIDSDPSGLVHPARYGNFCGPALTAICVRGPGGGWVPAPPPTNPPPKDALDAACMAHDCCLKGTREVIRECIWPVCNPAFCAAMAAMSCLALYTDALELYECQYMKWKAMSIFCPGPVPPSHTL